MAVVKMKKLSVFAHKRDADALIRRLMRLRCVEVKRSESSEEGDFDESLFGDEAKCNELEKNIERIQNGIKLLSKYSTRKKGLSASKTSVRLDRFRSDGSYGAAYEALCEAERITLENEALTGEKTKLEGTLKALSLWSTYELPLSFEGTETTSVANVTLPASVTSAKIEEALGDIPAEAVLVGGDVGTSCYSLICYKGYEEEARGRLAPLGMLKAPLDGFTKNAAEEIKSQKKQLAEIHKGLNTNEERLRSLADKLTLIEILYDYEVTALRAEETKKNFASTELCIKVEGYLPENEEKRVSAALSKFGCAFEIYELDEGEEAPVLLRNNFFAQSFEWVLGMYSYPRYGTFDPTFIMSIFYFIIFGLMFADVGYGFILTVGCFAAIKLLNPGRGMRNFLSMFGYCGISSMIMGVLFGAYFGNMPQAFSEYMLGNTGASSSMQTAVLFDPMADPMSFLILSLAVGAVHLIAGMAVQFCILCKKGQWLDALFDIGTWWLTFAGIGAAVIFPWGKYLLIAGLVSIVLTQGRHEKNPIMKLAKGLLGIYGGVNYAADLLSYSRILALGLAASVIGQVINTMGMMGGPNIVGFLMMIAIFAFGHLLNLAINVLGTFVHTSRLQYIEFFGKFFEDGGRPFKPEVPSDKYTTEK